jgi:hypothetical protein
MVQIMTLDRQYPQLDQLQCFDEMIQLMALERENFELD